MNNLIKGNCCYINNDFSKLWLIVKIDKYLDLITLKTTNEEIITTKKHITEIIEN